MTLLSLFGFTALVLAAVGVYGLMAYSVAQRLGEIAVRAALGATSGSILRLFMLRGIVLSTTGVVLGTVTALALRRVVASELYGISGPEIGAFGLIPAVLLLIAGLACFIPALRATRVDPARLLRTA